MSERLVEIPWAVAQSVPPILDVGHAESAYLCALPGPVDGIDCRVAESPCLRRTYQGDIRSFEFEEQYETVLAVSTIEHVGLECTPYRTVDDDRAAGDRRALEGCVQACRLGGRVLMTLPFGRAEDYGWFRQYDCARLAELTDGFVTAYRVHIEPEWRVTDPSEAEDLMYDHGAGSARAVALVTIQKDAP